MLSGIAGAALGGVTQIGMGLYNSHRSASEARASDARQLRYLIKSARLLPKAQRQGLEAAGYNPMLALGNIGGSSAMASHQGTTNLSFDGSSARQIGEFAENLIKDKAQAEVDNIKADTDLKKGQLEAAEALRLQTEANTSLLHSQTERSDLAYGRDIVDTVTGIAGTVGSLYSAKAMRDIARSPTETVTTIHHGGKDKPTEIIKNRGKPLMQSSSKDANPNAVGVLGSSATSVAKEVAKALMLFAPAAFGAYGVGKLQEKADKGIRNDKRSNWSKGYKHFVPRLGL